tara:strand:- start:3515 stop:4738 length:1224 start_codon:yes stop_codon:yes gene_type:complete
MSRRNKCLSCSSLNLKKIIDLGMHSFADRFISKDDYSKYDPAFSLTCSLCKNCGLIQNDVITPPEERYQLSDYSYTASNSQYSINYWQKYSEDLYPQINTNSKDCLEIGSNDGTLLEFLKEKGFNVTGVDASPIMVSIAKDKGLNAYCGIFGVDKNKNKNIWENKKYDLIIANNVLNHSDDPISFCKGVANLLKNETSFFVFEQPYWKDLVQLERFDQIYHEHVLYFSVENAKNLMLMCGMEVFKVEHTNYHGGSIRIYSSKKNTRKIDKSLKNFLDIEKKISLKNEQTYLKLMENLEKKKLKTLEKILYALKQKRPIICLGAAAKANTLLTYYSLNSSIIDFITDTSPYKIGKFTPLTRIPIKTDEEIANLQKPLCIITSWNLSETILLKLKKINPTAELVSAHEL